MIVITSAGSEGFHLLLSDILHINPKTRAKTEQRHKGYVVILKTFSDVWCIDKYPRLALQCCYYTELSGFYVTLQNYIG